MDITNPDSLVMSHLFDGDEEASSFYLLSLENSDLGVLPL